MRLRYALSVLVLLAAPAGAQSPVSVTLLPQFESDTRPEFGRQVDAADLDGDGVDEILVGSFEAQGPEDVTFGGRVSVFSGEDGSLVRELVSPRNEVGGRFGLAVAFTGDLDGDGVPDILVTAPYERLPNATANGVLYVFSGATGSEIGRIGGFSDDDEAGFAFELQALPDVTNDGVPDFAAANASEAGGKVYVFSGADRVLARTLESPVDRTSQRFGASLGTIPDLDGDGVEDIVVGSPATEAAAYVFGSVTGLELLRIPSPYTIFARFGSEVLGLDDVTGDGVPDVVVVSARAQPDGETEDTDEVGLGLLYSGADGSFVRSFVPPFRFENRDERLAAQVVPDLDDDGIEDVFLVWPDVRLGLAFSSATGALLADLHAPETEFSAFGSDVAIADLASGPALVVGDAFAGDGDPAALRGAVYLYELEDLPRVVSSAIPVGGSEVSVVASPNPTTGPLALTVSVPIAQRVQIGVYDVLGRRVASRDVTAGAGESRHEVSLPGVAPGLYLVRIAGEGSAFTTRVTIRR